MSDQYYEDMKEAYEDTPDHEPRVRQRRSRSTTEARDVELAERRTDHDRLEAARAAWFLDEIKRQQREALELLAFCAATLRRGTGWHRSVGSMHVYLYTARRSQLGRSLTQRECDCLLTTVNAVWNALNSLPVVHVPMELAS
jgi:hypothetical protein